MNKQALDGFWDQFRQKYGVYLRLLEALPADRYHGWRASAPTAAADVRTSESTVAARRTRDGASMECLGCAGERGRTPGSNKRREPVFLRSALIADKGRCVRHCRGVPAGSGSHPRHRAPASLRAPSPAIPASWALRWCRGLVGSKGASAHRGYRSFRWELPSRSTACSSPTSTITGSRRPG